MRQHRLPHVRIERRGGVVVKVNDGIEHEFYRDVSLDAFLKHLPSGSVDSLNMNLDGKPQVFALVKAGPNLYRVQQGNYMGQNFGVVTAIDEGAINLKELVQDSGGEWVERTSALQLVEAKR